MMPERTVKVINPLGLHARAAAKLVRLAGDYQSSITITRLSCEKIADARSILSILELGAKHGSSLVVRADGDDAESAIEAMTELFESGFGET
jgi:phosphotransferase system HPr (HPr) family protein